MHRLIAIALFLLHACAIASPLLAQSQPEQRILLCCRPGGAHHCMGMTATDAPTVRPHCPATDPTPATPAASVFLPHQSPTGPLAALTPAPPLGSVAQPPTRPFGRIPARGPPQA